MSSVCGGPWKPWSGCRRPWRIPAAILSFSGRPGVPSGRASSTILYTRKHSLPSSPWPVFADARPLKPVVFGLLDPAVDSDRKEVIVPTEDLGSFFVFDSGLGNQEGPMPICLACDFTFYRWGIFYPPTPDFIPVDIE